MRVPARRVRDRSIYLARDVHTYSIYVGRYVCIIECTVKVKYVEAYRHVLYLLPQGRVEES